MDRRSLKTPVTPHQTLSPMDQRSGRKDGAHHQGGHRQIFPLHVDQRAAPPCPRLVGRLQLCQAVEGTALQRSEEHTSELQSLMRISYDVFCLKKKKKTTQQNKNNK